MEQPIETLSNNVYMNFDRKHYSNETLIDLYKNLVRPRMIEEKMLILLRQGKVGKWFSGIGQEAIAVGATMAMNSDEYILPMHRNLGVFTSRNIPLSKLIAQWQGKMSGFTKGRDRSFHFGTQEYKIVGMISHLGPQMALADGIALADLLENKNKATLVFTGEGATSEGDFHEALNVAAVWNLPVIFIIENNGYGLSTPTNEQYKCKNLVDRANGYGMKGYQIDGNNILTVYDTIRKIADEMRHNPQPVLIECMTFRMRGHEEASGTKYVPKELFDEWAPKDPVQNFENYLIQEGVINQDYIDELKLRLKIEIDSAVDLAFSEPDVIADLAVELEEMYAPVGDINIEVDEQANKTEKRYLDAITDAMRQAMQRHQNLVIMGQDVAEYGGAFKITQGFVEEFGKGRVRNTPICESAIVGTAFGLSINGYKAIMEMQFADFATCGFNQIVNNLAKSYYRWGQNADVVVRMPTGAGTGAGPFHSQSNEAWFVKTPGLKVVYPAFPSDAKGLLAASIEDPNPVIFFEHKYLYRGISEHIPDDYYTTPIGKAKLVKEGEQLSILTYGLGVHWALEYLEKHPEVSADVLDLRTLLPWDIEAVETTVKKNGKVLILHEDTLTCGVGAEIAAYIAENLFNHLDGPVVRCASLDTAIPMSRALEDNFLAKSRMDESIQRLLSF
ncbi:alpha-ketoacid dehydrogenase subunit alpha/beta [Solitalea canadensis]|uniref:Pyruvate/2-oxoglutarate dehydrogenase complex, dehydrogenase component beta subunit n=1 Tax=Solitalea canadensis (strain ATCC 29591 / DSM 3403 / JCM 21819 / LMG 8368 / NBRC 15130 / NCIMB 12057 / USAM 9D) TaxID=929556 RepID=H8KWR9_SOLCM|nr:dehydrogenase E1 component subunit alpha/beta [Solitalea canadensis]AFD08248.1 pyruvate/2-oxoglutarate dehydrogenase complex, dehydrogenase component beta subunit [Solitalea canadensis DSM 3403]